MLVQALEDIWAITPDPRRDRLTVAFVTHLVAMATDVSPGDISAHKRTSVAAARARQIAIYTHIKHVAKTRDNTLLYLAKIVDNLVY